MNAQLLKPAAFNLMLAASALTLAGLMLTANAIGAEQDGGRQRIEVAQTMIPAPSQGTSVTVLPPPRIADYWLSATRQEGGALVFDGYVPDDATRKALGSVDGADTNWLKLGSGELPVFGAALDFGIEALQHLSVGRLHLRNETVMLNGTAKSRADYEAVMALLDEGRPEGVVVALREINAPDGEESTTAEPIVAAPPAAIIEAPAEPSVPAEPPAPPPQVAAAEPVAPSVNEAPKTTGSGIALCRTSLAAFSARNAILFQSGAAMIAPESEAAIDELAADLGACPDAMVYIEGHTDADGDAQLNLALSVARAEAVVNALIARNIAPGRLYAVGYGESQPIADNDTAAGKRLNRRIVVTVNDEGG